MKYSLLQHLLSYIYPIKITSAAGKTTPQLGLYRFRGRWQLSAATALYSDGIAYRPLIAAFNTLQKELKNTEHLLVLGAGLGSAVQLLEQRYHSLPKENTLVDIDPQVISWGKSLLSKSIQSKCQWVCADVADFVQTSQSNYDLIVVDVFQDRIVPHFVCSGPFLQACKMHLDPQNGTLVLNYIINNEAQWVQDLAQIKNVFRLEQMIEIGINRVLLLKNNA